MCTLYCTIFTAGPDSGPPSPVSSPNPSINQLELARHLRLSHTTVSRALSNHPAINASTRARVLALADQLGYRPGPSRAVSRTRQARSLAFGVLLGRPLVPADGRSLPRLLEGIHRRASVESARVDVIDLAGGGLDIDPLKCRREVFRRIRAGGWRGALLLYPFPNDVVALLARKLPLVSLLTEYPAPAPATDLVDTDHTAVARHVAALVRLGHRHIGFLHWRYPAGGHWGSHRYAAYAAALAAHGLDLVADHVLNIHASAPAYPTPASIAARVASLSRKKSSPTAWLCAADHQAFALFADLARLGIQVPRDLSLAGFDGQPPPPGLPALATVRVPYEDIGASSVARLISRMLEPTSPRRVIHVDPTWDAGATLAKPRT